MFPGLELVPCKGRVDATRDWYVGGELQRKKAESKTPAGCRRSGEVRRPEKSKAPRARAARGASRPKVDGEEISNLTFQISEAEKIEERFLARRRLGMTT
jgi:hypothetical protein